MKKCIILVWVFIIGMSCINQASGKKITENNAVDGCMNKEINFVHKKVLSNGMTVLVRPTHVVPRVSLQLWYNVGSKDEKTGERGIAHLIEHMIFKGTKQLSECDINVISHKLSGSINAFTHYDYTGYLFNMPVQNYEKVLPVMADCMQNVSFKDDHLNSELKAVIQELKLYRDNYRRSLAQEMLAALFPDHPYHYPVIGFKQDLWNVHGDILRAFYKKHYWPNNATLVIVGDVNPEESFKLAEKYFGAIPANPNYKKETFFLSEDIISRDVTLYRDIQQPFVGPAYIIPGSRDEDEHMFDVLNLILGGGKASRLWRKLVDELKMVASVSTYPMMLFEHGAYFITFEPNDIKDVPHIIDIIQQEIDSIIENGLEEHELTRALKQAKMEHYRLLENIESQAYEIGRTYLATGDPDYAFKYLDESSAEIEKEIQRLLAQYFRPAVRNVGIVLPLPDRERELSKALQKESDELDTKILMAHPRTSPVEAPKYALKVHAANPPPFNFPKPETFTLSNGLKVLYHHAVTTPKVDIAIELKAKPYYEPEDKPGIYAFMAGMLTEGTKKYSAKELADELENRGMSLNVVPGGAAMSMLSSDLETGLNLLEEVLANPRFDADEIEKVRTQMLIGLKNFWDEPSNVANQLMYECIYKGHPLSKCTIGTESSLKNLTREDLIALHKIFISPQGATIAIVGDLDGYDLKNILERTLGTWKGPIVETLPTPAVSSVKSATLTKEMNRDQIVLCLAGLSIKRTHPDYDKLLLFDQIFGGGVLGSMHSRLFSLREQSGLFYTIRGSLISDVSEEPGLVMVKTKVSLDRLEEAEKRIKKTIDTAADNVSDEEFAEAKQAIVNSIINYFASNQTIAQIFLMLNRYGLPANYYDTRSEQLAKISKQDMINAVKKILNSEKMVCLKVGRLDGLGAKTEKADKE